MDKNKEDAVQAIVIADIFNNNFHPITTDKPLSLLPVVGVPLINFVLESLSNGGVDETILFCCQDGPKIKEHINHCVKNKASWSLSMDVQVLISDTCRTMGDVMREIDAAGIVRGYFILTGINTITNIPFASLLDRHKQLCKKDKGAAMTLLYKKVSWGHRLIDSDKTVFLAANSQNKVLIHQKYKPKSAAKELSLPLEIVLNHSEVKLHHNLADVNIALCSPSVPPLFSDNFDFQTRDDFIYGILVNEEILNSSLYYFQLTGKNYAACISNWKTYQVISYDILHHWTYPLSIETGAYSKNKYIFTGNNNCKHRSATLSRYCTLGEDVMIGSNTNVGDQTSITKSIIGNDCKIGKNVVIQGSYIQNGVIIKDNCRIINSYIDNSCVIEDKATLEKGTIIASNVVVDKQSMLKESIIQNSDFDKNDKLLTKSTSESTEWENESGSGEEEEDIIGFDKVWSDSSSYCSSSSSEDLTLLDSPEPEDTNIFLHEVIDSLARGYDEKSKHDYLILEINSSRYAYNIQLHEVNFYVVRALLSMPTLTENKNALRDILKYFKPILLNYIKSKSSIMDCLRAVEDSCLKCAWLEGRSGQIVNLLYEFDVIDEDSLLEWREDLYENESPIIKHTSLIKFFEWLEEASEEESE